MKKIQLVTQMVDSPVGVIGYFQPTLICLAIINGSENDDMVEPYGRINRAYNAISTHVDQYNREREPGNRIFMGTDNSREITVHHETQKDNPFLKVNMVEFEPI